MENRRYFSHRDEEENIREIQTYLRFLSQFYPGIPKIVPDGNFGDETRQAVRAFQKLFKMVETGIPDFETWTEIVRIYDETLRTQRHPKPIFVYPVDIPRMIEGDRFEEIYILQIMLRRLSKIFENIHMPEVTGVFDADTRKAVEDFSKKYGDLPKSEVDRELWNIIADTYSAFTFND